MFFPFLHPNPCDGQNLLLDAQELHGIEDANARLIDSGGELGKIPKLVRHPALQFCFFSQSVWELSHWEVLTVAASVNS